jgi:hypothetical protein
VRFQEARLMRRCFVCLVALGAVALGPGAATVFAAAPSALGDFNGDGRADLAVGATGDRVGTVSNAGLVNVLYGADGALSTTGNQLWHQDKVGALDAAETGDGFGYALAAGDFNGDGRGDLAVGVPGEDSGAGAVHVFYGSASGLRAAGNQLWSQDSPGVGGDGEPGDKFGVRLAAGDINGDGRADLAIGVPFEDSGRALGTGAVNVLYGTGSGLSATGSQGWTQDSPGVLDEARTRDYFGDALAAGDFDGDGRGDLAVGVPGDEGGGAISVLYGAAGGLSAARNQHWTDDSPGIVESPPDPPDDVGGDWLGGAVAAGDINGDARADLIAGARYENLGTAASAGAIHVLYGAAGGLSAAGNQFCHQDSAYIKGAAEEGDYFGWALTVGDMNGDGRADVAVGVLGEALGTASEAGAVNVLYGGTRLSAAGNQLWHQNSPGILEEAERFDEFGGVLTAGDFSGDGTSDLAVGVPGESVGTVSTAGAVNVLYGGAAALSASGNQLWHQDSPGVLDNAEDDDAFGLALASGAPAAP